MSGFVLSSKLLRMVITPAVLVGVIAVSAGAEAPERVVSMNLCTDQLAMMLSTPEQLYSVSDIASDPRASAMATEAAAYPVNYGRAEEIHLMQPDLVLASVFSPPATLEMFRRLGIKVEQFAPAYSLTDVRARIEQMGHALGREDAARQMLADFDARLAELTAQVNKRPRAALYYANGYTSGDQTLAGQMLVSAGFENIATEAGYAAFTQLPLEVLAMTNPDIVITAPPYPGASRSEEIMEHPVVQNYRSDRATAIISDHDWVCGTPYVLRAIENLAQARKTLEQMEK